MFKGLRKKALALLLYSQPTRVGGMANDPSSYDKILKQVHDFETAFKAMDYLLDDRTQDGIDLLQEQQKRHVKTESEQPAAIFPLALGVMEFIEATLGFEPEVMERAHQTLSEAEAASMNNVKYNVRYLLGTSHIYPPGTEFQVTNAELTLLNALLMLLQESNGVVESAKALFKLRKAYQTLDSIYKKIKELEPVFNKNLAKLKKEASLQHEGNSANVSTVDLPGYLNPSLRGGSSASLPQDVKLLKNLEAVYQMRKSRIEGTSLNNPSEALNVNMYAATSSGELSVSVASAVNSVSGGRPESPRATTLSQNAKFRNATPSSADDELDDEDDEFSDASDTFHSFGNLSVPHLMHKSSSLANSQVLDNAESVVSGVNSSSISLRNSDQEDNHMHVSTVDEYIHSGVQLCFGILQVVLSLIPPTIGKVLSIVGFRGDRETGLKMLWRTAITSRNIHGELALLCLLVFYDGPVQFIDDGYQLPGQEDANVSEVISIDKKSNISDKELEIILKNPALYTPQLLTKVRGYFPHNALWLLQEGRMLAAQGQLVKAATLMQSFTDNPETKINMQQVEALLIFDRAMLYAFKHDYDEAARDFIYLLEINSWSKSIYLYFAGSCYLEKWRMIKLGMIEVEDREKSLKYYGDQAELYLKKAPTYVPGHGINASNKKGGIGGGNKQMPFDKFLLRKLQHIEKCQKKHPKLSFLNCFGTSPIHELIYFWNGYNRMNEPELKLTLTLLGYSGALNSDYSANNNEQKFAKFEENEDEAMIRYFFQSITLRLLNRLSEGVSLLDSHVISKFVTQDSPNMPFKFIKMTYSPYLYPTALYERSMFVWLLRTSKKSANLREAIEESKSWLKKAEMVGDGDYELSNRTGMKIKAAGDRLDQFKTQI